MQTQSVQEANTNRLLKKHNVCGTGVGEKWVDGTPTGEEAVLVFVQKKYSQNGLFRKFSVKDEIPKEIDGIPTDVIEVGHIQKQGFRGRTRPLVPGHSCGHGDITAGTMGGFFYDKDGTPVILSNNHVIANENAAKAGDLIYQPGPMDTRANRNFKGWDGRAGSHPYIGKLKKFVRMNKSNNTQDSAIAEIHPSLVGANLVNPIYPTINRTAAGFGDARVNMQIQKCGRTTGYTTGRVLGLNGTFSIEYDFGVAKFNKCVVTTNISRGGDSGSVIFDMDMNAVALLFAGSPKVTIANPMSIVQQHYGLKIWDAPPVETVKIGTEKWRIFTTDGTIKQKNGTVTFADNANHHCFVEHPLSGTINSVSCVVNTGTDRGATWGPGLVLQFPTGMLKVNLRFNGAFGGYFNSNYSIDVGKVKPNTDYPVRLRRDSKTWFCEVKEGRKWFTAMAVPRSIFPMDPIAVRIGKTGSLGSTRDHSPPRTTKAGPAGECTIRDLKIS